MALLSVIRRWHFRDHLSIREIAKRTGLSRNTIRKYLRSDTVEPQFNVPERPSKLDPFAERLSAWLRRKLGRSRKQKRTIKQLHADLVILGSTSPAARSMRRWSANFIAASSWARPTILCWLAARALARPTALGVQAVEYYRKRVRFFHGRAGQRAGAGEGSGQSRADRRKAWSLRPRDPRRTWLSALQRFRRRFAVPSVEQTLRAHQCHPYHQPQLQRVGQRVR
ncbi:hypothetical protein SAMN02927924_04721 [Sphingobium faniae]|nr:hypothetical protein SAMN02927924_04721 [Sphingobium faniae]